ncbi:hypothetical protein J5U23_01719 [Saccharolobus shibatae B12]|uniref:Uncharacterized protein n=1 Tax=Saccharolobus shibatae (strain ATCC 51178 / DSM 5389 / JCM 8931 / NBRC 15437 / B12) TaxID=523848 RepID=A0A8F5BP25_SACSH|nr:hypothetical protein J5U23_01719 [Saccharolobus shibatae B12]
MRTLEKIIYYRIESLATVSSIISFLSMIIYYRIESQFF